MIQFADDEDSKKIEISKEQREEIHNCLNIILGLTTIIEKNCKDKEIKDRLQIIDSQAKKIEGFIET